MRIVAGDHKGRPLEAPKGGAVRPTSSLARESLFNVLSHGRFAAEGSPIVGATVLDAFAGSGGNGLEALSRGAAFAFFMENHKPALTALRKNISALGETAHSAVIAGDVQHPPPARTACNLVILDPPYREALAVPALTALATSGWIAPDALVAVELAKKDAAPELEGFQLLDTRQYGKAKIAFLQPCRMDLSTGNPPP